jgi:PAS domain S-box-containing protein
MHPPQPSSSLEAAGDDRRHVVHFYERDEDLAGTVAQFVGEGLRSGEAAVIVASEPHCALFVDRLKAMNIDVEAARTAGALTILDASATLAKLMVHGLPDAALFKRVVGSVIESLCTRGARWVKVRAYGEMVDLLWRAGNQAGAIALEDLWNELAGQYPFDLFCAYALDGFQEAPHARGLPEVCEKHSHVSTAEAGAAGPEAAGASARALAAEIAHRKQVERTLRSTVRELRRAEKSERERADRNERAAQELSDTIRVNELFMGVLAHDLRAPLGAIVTAAQLMKLRDAATPDSRNTKALSRVLNSSERMSRMIEQLLDFTRLRVGGGIELEAKSADLATLVKQVVDELEGSYPECDVEVTQAGDTAGSWDADRLGQVLSNMVANALQHGVPSAGVRVFVDGRARDAVCVQVHNMGAIPPALIPHVFDPLTGGQRRRDRSRGLGLGLFISKRVAAAHGGDVMVTSSEMDGTTFALSLPRFTNEPDARTNLTTPPSELDADGVSPQTRENISLAALAQDQLRASEARFRLLVEAVKDYAIFMLDPSGRVMTWNAGAQRIKGYEARDIIGRHFSQFYEEDEIRAGKCERELEGATRDGRFEDEGWRVRKDGTRFWANVVITALRGENGELVGFAKVTRDLTDRRRLEQEQISLARAEEAIRLRDEFLSLAAHELKTPLTVLQLQLDTLHERVDDAGQRMSTKLQRAAQSSERLANLIESLLDVSRIATGRFALAIDEFDFADSVLRVVDGLRPSADRARCELLVDSVGPIVGAWDRLRLEQAMTNLLANAIKYGAGKPVRVAIRQHGAEVVLDVRDHGPGIPEPDLARIFERFERATSIRNYGGLGLGLYMIRAIVDAHGGTVTAENARDGGACFRVTLPLRVTDPPTTPGLN